VLGFSFALNENRRGGEDFQGLLAALLVKPAFIPADEPNALWQVEYLAVLRVLCQFWS